MLKYKNEKPLPEYEDLKMTEKEFGKSIDELFDVEIRGGFKKDFIFKALFHQLLEIKSHMHESLPLLGGLMNINEELDRNNFLNVDEQLLNIINSDMNDLAGVR